MKVHTSHIYSSSNRRVQIWMQSWVLSLLLLVTLVGGLGVDASNQPLRSIGEQEAGWDTPVPEEQDNEGAEEEGEEGIPVAPFGSGLFDNEEHKKQNENREQEDNGKGEGEGEKEEGDYEIRESVDSVGVNHPNQQEDVQYNAHVVEEYNDQEHEIEDTTDMNEEVNTNEKNEEFLEGNNERNDEQNNVESLLERENEEEEGEEDEEEEGEEEWKRAAQKRRQLWEDDKVIGGEQKGKSLDLSIIIPVAARNPIFIRNLLRSLYLNVLLPQTSSPNNGDKNDIYWEVVVVQFCDDDENLYGHRLAIQRAVYDTFGDWMDDQEVDLFPFFHVQFLHDVGESMADAYNMGARAAKGRLLMLFVENMEVPNDWNMETVINLFEFDEQNEEEEIVAMDFQEEEEEREGYGEEEEEEREEEDDDEEERKRYNSVIFGTRVVYGDGTIFHVGVDFMMSKYPPEGKGQWWSGQTDEKPNVPLPYHVMQGYNMKDMRAGIQRPVPCVSHVGMLLSRTLMERMGGFNSDKYPNSLFTVDLCVRLHIEHKETKEDNLWGGGGGEEEEEGEREGMEADWACIQYIPAITSVYFDTTGSRTPAAAIGNGGKTLKAFADTWGDLQLLRAIAMRDYSPINVPKGRVGLIWNMFCGVGAIFGFTTESVSFVMGLYTRIPLHLEIQEFSGCVDALKRTFPVVVSVIFERLEGNNINSVEFSERELVLVMHRDPGLYSSHYNTYRTRNPDYVIGRSMFETDTIPNHWIDPCNTIVNEVWVPSQFNVETFVTGGVIRERLYQVPEAIDTYTYDPDITEALHVQGTRSFNFLTVMKWEKRKGWDILLDAFLDTFTMEDDVALFVRSSLNEEARLQLDQFISNKAEEKQVEVKDLPPVIIMDAMIPFPQLPSLYAMANCFVLATHGEGWGLPIIEAMAMGLPTIATNWGGNTQFMSAENSFPIEVEEMVFSNEDDPSSGRWASASTSHLAQNMRYVLHNRQDARKIGMRARKDIVSGFTLDKVAELVMKELSEIISDPERLEKGKQENEQRRNPPPSPSSSSRSWSAPRSLPDLPEGRHRIKIISDA